MENVAKTQVSTLLFYSFQVMRSHIESRNCRGKVFVGLNLHLHAVAPTVMVGGKILKSHISRYFYSIPNLYTKLQLLKASGR